MHYLLRFFTFLLIGALALASGFALADEKPPINYANAQSAMQQKDWATANYEWRQILELDPGNIQAKEGLAQSLFNTEFYEEAIALLESIPNDKRSLLASLGIARTYDLLKKYEQSRDAYAAILARNPFQAQAFSELKALTPKLAPADRKDIESKLASVAKSAKTKGDKALEAGLYSNAASYYEIARSYDNTVGLVNDYGILLLLSGQYDKAHEQFLALKRKNKLGFSEVTSNAAMASLSIGNLAEAKSEILTAINAAPNDRLKAQLYNNMGYILEMAKKKTEAKFAYEHALELNPKLLTARKNLAYVLQANLEYPEAIAEYQRILKEAPKDADLWIRLGFVHELQYKSHPAMHAYQKAIEADPKSKDAYLNLALLYKKMHRLNDANETLKKLMALSYEEIEAPKVAAANSASGLTDSSKNPLKYVLLFPANPKVLAKLQ